jgi:hypothetical protein
MEVGDVLLVQGEGFVDDLIRFGERKRVRGWWFAIKNHRKRIVCDNDPTSVAHAAVYVGNHFVIEALADGLNLSPVEKYSEGTYLLAKLSDVYPDVCDQQRQALAKFARDQLANHDKYGWLSILSVVMQMLTPIKLDISWDGALICSAFAGQCWEHAGVTLSTPSSLTTTPTDLALMAGFKLRGSDGTSSKTTQS